MDTLQVAETLGAYTKQETADNLKYVLEFMKPKRKLFAPLQPSTLTAGGALSKVTFVEKDIIHMLPEPTGDIISIGCNYGEYYNPKYVKEPVEEQKKPGRGRKPKIKEKKNRKSQGSGKYFNSQITFVILNSTNNNIYKIKLFQNGSFQVPGVKNPDISDLYPPIETLRNYMRKAFLDDTINVVSFCANMRNYKSYLLNPNYHVDLKCMEVLLREEKNSMLYTKLFYYMTSALPDEIKLKIWKSIKNMHPMNFAELSYNSDRCFALIPKFYRPTLQTADKKATVKLLKKGKINFDGANSEQEVALLYHWLEYFYDKHFDLVICDITKINHENAVLSDCSDDSIYDYDIEKAYRKLRKSKRKKSVDNATATDMIMSAAVKFDND